MTRRGLIVIMHGTAMTYVDVPVRVSIKSLQVSYNLHISLEPLAF